MKAYQLIAKNKNISPSLLLQAIGEDTLSSLQKSENTSENEANHIAFETLIAIRNSIEAFIQLDGRT